MADEQLAIAPSGPETATVPEATTEQTNVDEPVRIPSPEEASEEQQATEAAQVEDETVEVEWDDGKTYKIPKALESGILKNKDYTTKTQSVAAKAKELESREAEITQRLQATDEELNTRAQLRQVDAEIERFKDYDWNAFQQARQTDLLGAQEAWDYAQHLRQTKAGLEQVLGQSQQKRAQAAQQDLAKRFHETLAEAPKFIPGWTPETADKTIDELVRFANSEGIPEQFLKDNWSPTLLKFIHRAQLGHNLLSKTQAAPKPPAVPLAPLATVNGKSTPAARGDLASADMETYVALRKKGVGGKALS
jgi:hypothetical protein